MFAGLRPAYHPVRSVGVDEKNKAGMKKIKRIGILTSGGAAPGLNAVIRAVVITATLRRFTSLPRAESAQWVSLRGPSFAPPRFGRLSPGKNTSPTTATWSRQPAAWAFVWEINGYPALTSTDLAEPALAGDR